MVVLCYHKVGTELAEGRRLNVHPARLASHICYFKRRGYRFVKGSEADHWFDDRVVCFTFDDGFASTLDNGAPVFDRHQVPMTVYAVSNQVGKTSEWEGETPKPLADWDALRNLQASGHEVGNHTANHLRLAGMAREDQMAQVVGCREECEAHGLNSGSFCYPYGSLDQTSLEVVRECGYRVGMALGKRPATRSDTSLAIPRIVIAYGDALPMLLYKLHLKPLVRGKR